MNRILLALTVLGAGAGGFLTTRQSTSELHHEANAAHEAWLAQTQLVAVAQGEQAGLIGRVRELKQALSQVPAAGENALWSALQTNRAVQLTPELRERLLEELGFNWQSSPDFIVITKQSLRDAGGWMYRNGKCSEMEAAILAMTPEELRQVKAAMLRARTEINDWVLARVERSTPTNGVTVEYISPDSALWLSAKTNFEAAATRALRRNRAELLGSDWMGQIGLHSYGYQTSMVIAPEMAGNQRLKVEISRFNAGYIRLSPTPPGEVDEIRLSPEGIRTSYTDIQTGYLPECKFPDAFRCTFPNGWADVAEREGFELPKESPEK